MKLQFDRRKRSSGGLAASVVLHVAIALLLAQLVFRYPIGILLEGYSAAEHIKPETLHYVRVGPQAPPSSVQAPRRAPAPKAGRPAPLIAPTAIPTQVPTAVPSAPPAQAAGGTGNGQGVVGGTGITTGVVPALPDARIKVEPGYFTLPLKTPAEKIDSIVADLYGAMLDSLEAAGHQRKPGDWTVTKDGKKYGWDQQGIQLGKFMIPNALFALLPLKVQANPTTNDRFAAGMREDLLFHAQMAVTEDEFKRAVERIRARNEKLHEAQEKAKSGGSPLPDSTSR
jgi:hypothetical protein